MKDIREMAAKGATMEQILSYLEEEVNAAAKIIEAKKAEELAKKKAQEEKEAKRKAITNTLINNSIEYCRAFDLIPEDAEIPEEVYAEMEKALKNFIAPIPFIAPTPAAPAEKVVVEELDEETLSEILNALFGTPDHE